MEVNLAQVELEQNLELIEAKQTDLHTLLTVSYILSSFRSQHKGLETEIAKLDHNAGPLGTADEEREKGYQQAERINAQLDQMSSSMKELIDKLNRSEEVCFLNVSMRLMERVFSIPKIRWLKL